MGRLNLSQNSWITSDIRIKTKNNNNKNFCQHFMRLSCGGGIIVKIHFEIALKTFWIYTLFIVTVFSYQRLSELKEKWIVPGLYTYLCIHDYELSVSVNLIPNIFLLKTVCRYLTPSVIITMMKVGMDLITKN